MTIVCRILLCTLLLAVGFPAGAQPTRKVPRIGYLAGVSATADAPRLDAFRQGLRELDYVEGQSIQIEYRHESLDLQRLPDLAAELVHLNIDVLVAVTSNAAVAAKKTTSTVPIVFMGVTDPIATGLAESLARPGGNATGITNVAAILAGKRLRASQGGPAQGHPRGRSGGTRTHPARSAVGGQQGAADKLGLQLYSMQVSNVEEYVAAFKGAAKARNHAVWVTLNPVANSNQKMIAELAIDNGLPSICARSSYAKRLPDGVGQLPDRGPAAPPATSTGSPRPQPPRPPGQQ